MSIRGILLDIDNTLYDYRATHRAALSAVMEHLSSVLSIDPESAGKAFEHARKRIHIELAETAASHSRILYFQRMLESLGRNALRHTLDCYDIYWDSFLDGIRLRDGVYRFLERVRGRNVCLVTDLTAHIQHRKVRKLRLDDYAGGIVSSEEAGRENPPPYIFLLGMRKIGTVPAETCMIGDSMEKDMEGALNLGIKPFWLHPAGDPRVDPDGRVTPFRSFTELSERFDDRG